MVAGNYCAYAREFVDYLARRGIEITDITIAGFDPTRAGCHR
jgi:hypothetical protein